ncbi:MAG: hypothetical protein C0593_04270 [Marinilabiliales bacterium]|nr:MAG: hypothetical protein C0593_04270 [Marinilabiliales bacterium]
MGINYGFGEDFCVMGGGIWIFGSGVVGFWPDLPFERVELKSIDLALTPIPHQNQTTKHTPPNQPTSNEPHYLIQ